MSFLEIFLLGGLAILVFNTLLWGLSLVLKDSSIVDPFWGVLFLLSTLVYFGLAEGNAARKLLILVLVGVWSLRLSGYLAWRNWGTGEDFRYVKWRERAGASWWWRSFFKVFLLQGVLAWLISAPLLAAQFYNPASGLGWLDALGVLVWGYGFFFESVGDYQLARFRANTANQGAVLNSGVWRYTRHPNYFGDAAQWWGFYLVALAAGAWWVVFSPVLMTYLLVFVSGVALLERSMRKKEKYADYIARTSAFFPWFPRKVS